MCRLFLRVPAGSTISELIAVYGAFFCVVAANCLRFHVGRGGSGSGSRYISKGAVRDVRTSSSVMEQGQVLRLGNGYITVGWTAAVTRLFEFLVAVASLTFYG